MRTTLAQVVGGLVGLGCVGCVADLGTDPVAGAGATKDEAAVILGTVDWQEAGTLAEGTAQRQNAHAVALLQIPAQGSRCTGFLIAPDVVMTNEHCIPDAASARGVTAFFGYELGAAGDTAVDCSTFLGNDAALDFALLQCAGRPGDVHGVVELEARGARRREPIYVLHQNCDYYSDPSCAPTKKLSPGAVRDVDDEISHDADTLGGSSGSPLFSSTSHKVIGLHHVGVGGDGRGRGTMNRAVPMTRIVPVLQQRYPGVQLGGRAPTAPSTMTPTTDLYEPNDTRAGATAVQVPFSSQAARLDHGDTDLFTWHGDGGTHVVTLTFTHAAGDLDLYVYDGNGAELARSIGTTDRESVSGAWSGPVFARVVGYRGAIGDYTITVE